MSENQHVIESARLAFGEAVMAPYHGNLDAEQQRKVLAEVKQLVVDMLDYCEQTDIAEPALCEALDALDKVVGEKPNRLRDLVLAMASPAEHDVYTAWVLACSELSIGPLTLKRDAFVAYEVGRLCREVGAKTSGAQELFDKLCEADKKRGVAEAEREKFAVECRRLDTELHAAKRELERMRAERDHS